LIIEVDGFSHEVEGTFEKDIRRQKDLEDNGYRVVRFQNMDVLRDIRNVITSIENIVDERKEELNKPHAHFK
jgi:very-short-patch-repair endonuclease